MDVDESESFPDKNLNLFSVSGLDLVHEEF